MRCPKCRTLILVPAIGTGEAGSLFRCPRCPAVWLVRPEGETVAEMPIAPPMTRRGPLIIEGEALPAGVTLRGSHATVIVQARSELGRYGIAAATAVLMLALVAVVLLAPDVSAVPGIALLEGSH